MDRRRNLEAMKNKERGKCGSTGGVKFGKTKQQGNGKAKSSKAKKDEKHGVGKEKMKPIKRRTTPVKQKTKPTKPKKKGFSPIKFVDVDLRMRVCGLPFMGANTLLGFALKLRAKLAETAKSAKSARSAKAAKSKKNSTKSKQK
ncbi:hypothetical protein H2201_005036 [Coniosporium apollinis]|uniref:Uncharacterized protein n=1 Tax=Coniosporium apollinis TaxID=61459 RepID=A0ABQ9NQY7_9PEZI|nr:hypothetical protein H2201_005036 [Coniosporium apollinis]